jgi:hypothetical protein
MMDVERKQSEQAHLRNEIPTVFHITYWKAGSRWIYKILRECVPGRIVRPKMPNNAQFLNEIIQSGKVYPALCIEKQDFDLATKPNYFKKFIVIRDLRDTLVSDYFSLKFSHPIISNWIRLIRDELNSLSIEAGILRVMDENLPSSARIQKSWCGSGAELIRYEDLLLNDVEIIERVLIDECRLPMTRQRLRQVVLANRFSALTGGRPPGSEDRFAHQRKGISGDWQNHFTPRVTAAFKDRYAGLLVDTGYELNHDW